MKTPVLQLHGILRAPVDRRRLPHPHRVLNLGVLAALVSRCPFDGKLEEVDPAALSDRVMTHHDLLVAYSAEHVLLPTRFGAFFSSIDAVRQGLAREEKTHLASLAYLSDRREFNVRLVPSDQPTVPEDAPVAQQSGAQFLDRRRRARDRRQTARQDATFFARQVAQALEEIHAGIPHAGRDALLDVTMLLTDQQRSRLQTLIHEHGPRAERLGLLLQASGPWPAYSFNALPTEGETVNGA